MPEIAASGLVMAITVLELLYTRIRYLYVH
jgi:hypothetical protein